MGGKSLFILALFILSSLAYAGFVGSAYIYAPAVLTNVNKGTLTTFYLNVTNGNGSVFISGPESIGSSTIQSAEEGVRYACKYLGLNESDYNFYYTISDKNVSVSGPSGGLAFTLDAISALSHIPLLHDFTLTGTINSDGTVGQIGGVYDKVSAAKENNLKFVLVPYAENGSFEDLLYYISQQRFGIPLVEVKNASQAFKFATGEEAYYPLNYSYYTNYTPNSLPYANLTCNYCNISGFENLTAFTFDFVNSTISKIPNRYIGAKSNFESLMDEYSLIAGKGYLYTAADFAFLIFPQAFMLANAGNVSSSSASSLISNVSSYCSFLVPPQLTNSNYEYVIGGELRQELGNITAKNAATMLNASDTSDGILESIYTAGEADGWCLAANRLYDIASSIGGRPVEASPSLKAYAESLINNASRYGNNIYLQSAIAFYNQQNYPAAVYAGIYANVFGVQIAPNYTPAEYIAKEHALISNSTYGIWPNQFAKSAEFYINEYNITKNVSYLQNAYFLALLASRLSNANKLINSTFVPSPLNQTSATCSACSNLSNEMQQLYFVLVLILIILFVVLIFILIIFLRMPPASPKKLENRKRRQIR